MPVSRWLGILRDIAGPAVVQGFATDPVEFRGTQTTRIEPGPGGVFRSTLPQGEYEVASGGSTKRMTLLPGGTSFVDFRERRFLDIRISHETARDGTVSLKAAVTGSGPHKISIRGDGVTFASPERQFDLKPGAPQTVIWQGKIAAVAEPWVAVITPDGDATQRQEATGSAPRP